MNKDKLNKLIFECVTENRLKTALKKMIVEVIEEIKSEKSYGYPEMMADLNTDVQKINKEYSVTLDAAGGYNVIGNSAHTFRMCHVAEDKFDVTYLQDGSDRTKTLNMPFETLQKLVKKKLESNEPNYVKGAFNKSANGSKPEKGKDLSALQKPKNAAEDAVTKKHDLPDQPMKSVESIKKQSDHSVKGVKADYKYPKQKNNKLVVKLKSTKMKSKKS